ncbi:MAG TPA: glycine/sarcosine/betaine reductase component B subunit [Candidatus Dormibacteraeota bacterium]|nr:glycine/sarcosine/betaine reductase component B subunit [Candidatus Dormibacteraeota bacterium]
MAGDDGRDGGGGAFRRAVHRVTSISCGEAHAFRGGHLTVGTADAVRVLAHPALASTRVSCVSPGESARLVKILDAVEPRCKGTGGGGVFPGIVGPPSIAGRGEVHVLRGAAVVVAGHLPRAQEALVDLSGPAAPLSPLGVCHDVVIEFERAEGASWADVDSALREGALRLAEALAQAALPAVPDSVEEVPGAWGRGASGLPRVGAITNLQTQGAFKDVLVYGRSFAGGLPSVVHPAELDDGAVVSCQYGHPSLKNPTYVFQNHPVALALLARDGVDLEFGGVILSPEPVEQARKEMVAEQAARLARALGLDAAIVTKEGGGNADADVALKIDALEAAGIAGIGIFAEMSGADGTAAPLVVPPQRATAMVSTGNYDEVLALPAVERALGGARFEVAGTDAASAMDIPVAAIYGSLNPLGWGRLTARPAAL